MFLTGICPNYLDPSVCSALSHLFHRKESAIMKTVVIAAVVLAVGVFAYQYGPSIYRKFTGG